MSSNNRSPVQGEARPDAGARSKTGARASLAVALVVLATSIGVGAFVLTRTGEKETVTGAAATEPSVSAPVANLPASPSSPDASMHHAATTAASGAIATVSGTSAVAITATPTAEAEDDGEAGGAAAAKPTSSQVGLTDQDRAAGLRTKTVPNAGSGVLKVVPGTAKAPGSGPVKRVRVQVESGLDVDGVAFANTVMATLNDPRSWGNGGRMTFARVSSNADITVVLASPQLSASICRPLVTYGRLSCRSGNSAVLTMYRWVNGTTDYGKDRANYRRYLVNHEVGHVLGHGHQPCPGRGRTAPVMQQQTKGLLGCRANPWPFP